MRTFLFEKEIRLFGLKRSGNNAMIMYVVGHFDQKRNIIVMVNTDFNFRSRTGSSNPFGFSNSLYTLEKKDPECQKYLMITTENYDLAEIRRRDDDKKYSFNKDRPWYVRTYGTTHFSREALDILLIRSPHNNLASVMKIGWRFFLPIFADMWIMYAKEAVGETSYLKAKVPCLFDNWFSSVEYRKNFCFDLGLDHNDDGLNRIRSRRRSSFNGMKYKYEAQKMKVLDRWKAYRNDKEFLDILRNDELIDLTERLFGYNLRDILDL